MSLEIELLEILNGDRDGLSTSHILCVDHLGQLGLIEKAFDPSSLIGFTRISPLGEAWLAHYHGRVH